jgi:presenilin-like A22 family membrane protease
MTVEIAIILGLISVCFFFIFSAFSFDKKYWIIRYLFLIVSIVFIYSTLAVEKIFADSSPAYHGVSNILSILMAVIIGVTGIILFYYLVPLPPLLMNKIRRRNS